MMKAAETSINAAGGHAAVDYRKIAAAFSQARTRFKLTGYVIRALSSFQMLELFRQTAYQPPHGRALDIGCGYGVNLRQLRGWGVIAEGTGVDIYDVSSGFDESAMPGQHRVFRLMRFAERMQDRTARKPKEQWSQLERAVMLRAPTARRIGMQFGHRPDTSIYDLRMKARPVVDHLIVGDVFGIEDKFDLVTSFASLDWFTADEILAKIASLLNDGGFFYVWVTNWWHAVNTTNLFGAAPFAPQRMNADEFAAYVLAAMPDRAEGMIKAYRYFDPTHCTLADYVDIARRHGLTALRWQENILASNVREGNGMTSLGVAQHLPDAFDKAHADIKRRRPDVRQRDLMPYSYSILFRKTPASERLEHVPADLDAADGFRYRPTSLIGRTAQSAARKILGRT